MDSIFFFGGGAVKYFIPQVELYATQQKSTEDQIILKGFNREYKRINILNVGLNSVQLRPSSNIEVQGIFWRNELESTVP